ncbi:MAG: PQQ-dependent sugar dehydrogenase [Maribacter sp.]
MKITYLFPLCAMFCFFISCSDENEITLSPIPDNSISLTNAFPNLRFNRPLDLQSPMDGTNRIFVAEQGGFIKVFENSETVSEATDFLDISSRTVSTSELGLLGFAFHPDYANNGFVFVTYTPREDVSVISRFKVSNSDANQIDVSSEIILFQIEQPFTNHNGGQLAFGPEGYLYIASGDGGGSGDPEGNAQNLGTLRGKLLRIDVDAQENGMNYAIPSDNPFVNEQGARKEIFAYGLRNPWRFSFDNQTNTIWAGDVGQGELEEINLIEKGGNYGWNILEGTSCYSNEDCDSTGTIAPFFEYNHSANDKSITGGYVYRGDELPELRGYYIYGDFISGRIWALDPQGNNQLLLETGLSISSFGTDANNELYICSFDGKVNRLTLSN